MKTIILVLTFFLVPLVASANWAATEPNTAGVGKSVKATICDAETDSGAICEGSSSGSWYNHVLDAVFGANSDIFVKVHGYIPQGGGQMTSRGTSTSYSCQLWEADFIASDGTPTNGRAMTGVLVTNATTNVHFDGYTGVLYSVCTIGNGNVTVDLNMRVLGNE